MDKLITKKKMSGLLCCGIIGCILMGAGDWLMIYGNTAFEGKLAWLTLGTAEIAPWRNSLAMLLSFPAIVFYSIALFALAYYFPQARRRRTYAMLTALGMTPWLCLHLFYTMILYAFSWMMQRGETALAYELCEALFAHFAWIVPVAEVLMLLPFFCLFWLIVTGKSNLPRWMAANNPLIVYIVLKAITMVLPDVPARLAFVNGLMSESMLICFVIFIVYTAKRHEMERV